MVIYGIDSVDVIKRVYPLDEQRHSLVLGIFSRFSLLDEEQSPASDSPSPSIWDLAEVYMPTDVPIDEGWPKSRGEFFAYGGCYWPREGHAQQPILASIRLADIHKRLAVFGDRHFTALGTSSAPEPFSKIDLSPQNAFGGVGFTQNPLGKGYTPDDKKGRLLPNVEQFDSLIVSKADQPIPAGFWALGPEAPSRTRYFGRFDEAWKKSRWPHLPLDTELEYFQAAPKDQQSGGYFRGDESIQINNMHPHLALIQSRLPGLRCRLLVSGVDLEDVREYETRIDTVWLFPDVLTGFALHRCVIPVKQTDAADITYALVAFEHAWACFIEF
jgi:hypothetical protein